MIDGLVLIDKPKDWTSHDIVNHVRKIFGTRRVGHAGTLDPFATGLLILGINKATKRLTELVGIEKTYTATAYLGANSTTDDPEGTVTHHNVSNPPSLEQLEQVLAHFRGGYDQTAPIFSAKKVQGKKLYELARAGKTEADVVLPIKHVLIPRLEIISYTWPELVFETTCSSGTYIRALARDIGKDLGTGAYLTELRRTHAGPYTIDQATPIADLTAETPLI